MNDFADEIEDEIGVEKLKRKVTDLKNGLFHLVRKKEEEPEKALGGEETARSTDILAVNDTQKDSKDESTV